MSERWHAILTPNQRAGAIAIILLRHDDPDAMGLPTDATGRLRHARILGLDDGVVTRVDGRTTLLMPHGGIAIVRAISRELAGRGVPLHQTPRPEEVYPEARSQIEAWCLLALSLAPSPLSVDILLEHNERWWSRGVRTIGEASGIEGSGYGRQLGRLIRPATVAAVGRSNVGKSSLLNALVGQRVALVDDAAGTTRDHVGVPVDLGGLVVRWVDTPGVDERISDAGEVSIARGVVSSADLIVHCIDAGDDAGVLDARFASAVSPGTPTLRVGTRADLGEHRVRVDARVSVGEDSTGLAGLVALIRDRLLPEPARSDPRPWRFWEQTGVGA